MNLENLRRREMDIEEEQDGGTDAGTENYSDANMSDASIERGTKIIAGRVKLLIKYRPLFDCLIDVSTNLLSDHLKINYEVCSDKRQEITVRHNALHLGQSAYWIFCVSLALHYFKNHMLSRMCQYFRLFQAFCRYVYCSVS